MPSSAFFAVLRDVTKLAASAADDIASQGAKMAAAADDIASMAGPAAAKTAGVAGDDLAVGAGQVHGISPNRELPALWSITKGSALNKLWLGALLLVVDQFLPSAITVALFLGALYLSFEGAEGVLDYFQPEAADGVGAPMTEAQKVRGAIRTDMVLSFEMLVVALSTTGTAPLSYKIAVLVLVGFLMTVGVYGIIGLIIRLDDMGLALLKTTSAFKQKLGRNLINAAPLVLKVLEPVGMIAMFAVAGGILLHMAHVELPHWGIALLADVVAGLLVGFMLKVLHAVPTKFKLN
jgi:uncharacterized protein